MLAADVALPLAVFYGLRAAGVNQWLALVLGSVTPAVRLAVTALRARRVELMGLFTLSLLAIGTAVLMLVAVVQGGKAYGRRHLTRSDAPAPRS